MDSKRNNLSAFKPSHGTLIVVRRQDRMDALSGDSGSIGLSSTVPEGVVELETGCRDPFDALAGADGLKVVVLATVASKRRATCSGSWPRLFPVL